MSKTYLNKQLPATGKINDTFERINDNSNALSADLDELYAQDIVLDEKLDQIINETDLDPNKDPEVTNARGTFDTVGDRLDDVDDSLEDLETPDFSTNTQQASVASLPTGAVDAPITDVEINGLTLVNSVENGDFSDGTSGVIGYHSTVVASDNVLVATGTGSLRLLGASIGDFVTTLGDELFVYALAKVDSLTNLTEIELIVSNTVAGEVTPSSANEYVEVYDTVVVNDTSDTDILIRAEYTDTGSATGTNLSIMNVHAINKTTLGIEDYTEEQMLDLVRQGYFEGMKSVENPVVETVGKNLFDKRNIVYDKRWTGDPIALSDYTSRISILTPIKVKEGQVYKFSGTKTPEYTWFIDNSMRVIGTPVTTSLITIPIGCTQIVFRFSGTSYDTLDDTKLEEGSVATTYEPYKSSILSLSDTPLRRVPNGVRDTVEVVNGEVILTKRVGSYTFTGSEAIIAGATLTNVAYFKIDNFNNYATGITQGDSIVKGKILNSKFIEFDLEINTTNINDVSKINNIYYNGTYQIGIILPIGSTVAEAQSALAGTKIQYQLDTPQVINLTQLAKASGQLFSFENGTMYLSSDSFHAETEYTVATNTSAKIDANTNGINANAKAITGVSETIGGKIDNSFYADLNAYYGNVKTADDGQDVSEWTTGAGTLSQDTTNVKIGSGSIRITKNDNNIGSLYAFKNNITLDLTKLNNGEVSDDNDYVSVVLYVSDIAVLYDGNTANSIRFSAGSTFDSGNMFYYNIPSGVLQTGWNYLNIKKSDFNVLGVVSWDSLQSIRVGWASLSNAQNEYASFQLIQLVKSDTLGNYPNPFQRNGVRDFAINSGEWFVGEEFGKVVFKELAETLDSDALVSTNTFNNFTATVEFVMGTEADDIGYLTLLGDGVYTDNSIYVDIYVNNVRLRSYENGLLVYSNIVGTGLSTLGIGTKALFKLIKEGSDVKLETIIDGETFYDSFTSNLDNLKLSIGSRASNNQNVLSASITEIPHAHHADIAEVAKGLTEQAKCIMGNWGNQTIPTSSNTILSFDYTEVDNRNMFDISNPTQAIINESGWYILNGYVDFEADLLGYRLISIKVNGTNKVINREVPVSSIHYISTNTILKLSKGDIIELSVFQNSGSALDTVYALGANRLEIIKIG